MRFKVQVSEPVPLSLDESDKKALEDLFYNIDLSYGANVQRRNAGALIQQILANSALNFSPLNSQTQGLKNLGGLIQKYLEEHEIKITEFEQKLQGKPYSKKRSPVDFKAKTFDESIELIELKTHFASSEEAFQGHISEAGLRKDFNEAVKAATGHKLANAEKFRFLTIVITFRLYRRPPTRSPNRPYRVTKAVIQAVVAEPNDTFAKKFNDHTEGSPIAKRLRSSEVPGIPAERLESSNVPGIPAKRLWPGDVPEISAKRLRTRAETLQDRTRYNVSTFPSD